MGYVVILVQTYCTEDNSCIFSSSTPTCVLTSNPPVASFHFSSACDPFFSFSSFIAWLNKSLKHSKPWHEVAAVTAAVSRGAIPLSFFLVVDTPRRRSLDALRSSNVAPVVCSWASNSSTVKVKSPVTYHADINSRSEPTHAATISSEDRFYVWAGNSSRRSSGPVYTGRSLHGSTARTVLGTCNHAGIGLLHSSRLGLPRQLLFRPSHTCTRTQTPCRQPLNRGMATSHQCTDTATVAPLCLLATHAIAYFYRAH